MKDRTKLTPMERAKNPGISSWRAWRGTTKQNQAVSDKHRTVVPKLTRLVKT